MFAVRGRAASALARARSRSGPCAAANRMPSRNFGRICRSVRRLVEQAHCPILLPRFQQHRPDHALFGGVGAGKGQAEHCQQPHRQIFQPSVCQSFRLLAARLLSVCAGAGGANIPIDRPAALCLHWYQTTFTPSKGEPHMRYDFTSILDRHGKDSIAVDGLGATPASPPTPRRRGSTPSPCGWRI